MIISKEKILASKGSNFVFLEMTLLQSKTDSFQKGFGVQEDKLV